LKLIQSFSDPEGSRDYNMSQGEFIDYLENLVWKIKGGKIDKNDQIKLEITDNVNAHYMCIETI